MKPEKRQKTKKCLAVTEKSSIFAPQKRMLLVLGLIGFDGKTKWYVSTRSGTMGGSIISSVGKLIGNNKYALAA